jgi:hypothetical protein
LLETEEMNIIHAIDIKLGQNLCKTLTKPKITVTKSSNQNFSRHLNENLE